MIKSFNNSPQGFEPKSPLASLSNCYHMAIVSFTTPKGAKFAYK
jgi:hypothetical protein